MAILGIVWGDLDDCKKPWLWQKNYLDNVIL